MDFDPQFENHYAGLYLTCPTNLRTSSLSECEVLQRHAQITIHWLS